MGLFSKKAQGPVVAGIAAVVPQSTANLGSHSPDGGNFNNFSAGARARSSTWLQARSAQDGGPVQTEPEQVRCSLPNWLRMVMHDAGTHHGQWEHLPAELIVPVWIDVETRQIVELDVAQTEAQLAEYREVGTREWKETEAMLAPVRAVVSLPGRLRREVPALMKDWGQALGEFREDLREGAPMRDDPVPAKEIEQVRRTAVMLRANLAHNPKQRETVRKGLLQGGPGMAAGVAAGTYPKHRFALWVMLNEISEALTTEEAAGFMATAGLAGRDPATVAAGADGPAAPG